MGEIHFDDTYLNQFGHFGALLDFWGQNVPKWPKMALRRLEQVETNVGTGWSPSELITMTPFWHKKCQLWCPEGPKMVKKRLSEGSGAQNGWNRLEHFKHFKVAKMGCTILYTFL